MVIPYSSWQFSGIHSNAVNGSAISVNYLQNNSQNGKPISEYIFAYTQGRLACDIMQRKKKWRYKTEKSWVRASIIIQHSIILTI